jgi:hypothetical protein
MSSHQFDEVAPLGVARVRLNPAGRVSPGSKPISLTNYTKPPKLCKEDCKSPSKNISTALAILRVNITLVSEGYHFRLNRCELNRFLHQNAKTPSAWTGETEPWITSSSEGSGTASNTKKRTCRITKPRRKLNACLANISSSIIGSGSISRSTTELRRQFIGSRLE